MRLRLALAPLAATVALLGACAAAPRPTPRPSLLEAATRVAVYESPARWRYHPGAAAEQLTRMEVDGGVLYAGMGGERWLVTDVPRAAAQLAPESLLAVSVAEGRWVFVGASGTAYEAESPLGPFLRASAPYEPLTHVSAANSTIIGLRADGRLSRSADAGATWERVGPRDADFVGVALGADGEGVALRVPEEIWVSADAGSTWNRLDVPKFGAVDVQRVDSGWLMVRGVMAAYRYRPGQTPPLEVVGATPPPLDLKLGGKPARGPSSAALAEGRAAIVGTRYYELQSIVGKRFQWRLVTGPVHGRLGTRKVADASGCRDVKLAGFDRILELACVMGTEEEVAREVTFLRSEDGGKTWARERFEARGRLADLKLAMGRDGTLLVSGVCLASASKRGCRAQGIHRRRVASAPVTPRGARAEAKPAPKKTSPKKAKGPQLELAPSAVPALRGVALGLAFSPDGESVYAVGRTTKGGGFAVYVSNDGGKSFEARELPLPDAASVEEEWRSPSEQDGYEIIGFSVAEDGILSVVVRRWGMLTLFALDEEGRVLSSATPPEGTAWLGAVGMRALALSGPGGTAWETLDGGTSWTPIGQVPVGPCDGDEVCAAPVFCHPSGCVVGDALSRIGWRGQGDDEGTIMLAPEGAPHRFTDRRVRTPIGCVLGSEAWAPLADVLQAPSAHQAAIRDVVWFTPVASTAEATAGAFVAKGGATPKLEYVSLLGKVARPEDYALSVTPQIEGVAALRYHVPGGGSGELTDVRVAWLNAFEDATVRTSLGRSLPYRPGDFDRGPGRAQLAAPALLSIAAGGIYLRPHAQSRDAQTTFFLDGRQVDEVTPVTWPSPLVGIARTEMVHVDSTHVPLMMWQNAAALARARRVGDAWEFDAEAMGLIENTQPGLRVEWNIAYDRGAAGLWVLRADDRGVRHSAFYRFLASGGITAAPLRVPSQRELGDTPRACSPQQRRDTPRVVAPYLGGTRHPVIVSDAREPLRVFLTDEAVVHGTPAEACVAAFDAELALSDALDSQQMETALVPVDDMAHAWLFRTVERATGRQVEYRPMECRFEPGAEIPDELYERPGTMVTY